MTGKRRKEPTVVFSIRVPSSLEIAAVELAQSSGKERNAFIVEAMKEKVERDRSSSDETIAEPSAA